MGQANTLYYPAADVSVDAFRAYFQLSDINQQVKQFVLNFDNDATSITEVTEKTEDTESWYDLSGRRIVDGKSKNGRMPKGIYIHKGKKKIIK